MSILQELETPIDQAIVNHAIEATPEHWREIRLTIVRSEKGDGMEGFEHAIVSPEGHNDVVIPPDELFWLTFRLADLFHQYGRIWKKAVYNINQLDGESWHYKVEFEYP